MQGAKHTLMQVKILSQLYYTLKLHRKYGSSVRFSHLGGYRVGGDPATEVTPLWRFLYEEGNCRTALDVGCGEGWHILKMQEIGYDVVGIEGLKKAIMRSPVKEHIILHDLTTKPWLFPGRRFDLVWCSEVVEHIEERFVGNIVLTLCGNCKRYLAMTYSDTPGGYHHVNCKPQDYWITLIEAGGLRYNEEFSIKLRELVARTCAGFRHFSKRGLIFERS